MEYTGGMDVSQRETAICVIDSAEPDCGKEPVGRHPQ